MPFLIWLPFIIFSRLVSELDDKPLPPVSDWSRLTAPERPWAEF